MSSKILPVISVLILIAIAAAVVLQPFGNQVSGVPVDAVFENSVNELSRLDKVVALTNPNTINGVTYQIYDSFITAYDPERQVGQQIYLFSIAKMFKLDKLSPEIYTPVAAATQKGDMVIDGIVIWDALIPIMREYAYWIGKPLTPLLFNKEKGTYEQYFECMGFTSNAFDGTGKISLLKYGAWWYAVDPQRKNEPENRDVTHKIPDLPPVIVTPFQADIVIAGFVDRLVKADPAFTGRLISTATLQPDGLYYRFYTNIVFIIDPASSEPQLLDLPAMMSYRQTTYDPPIISNDSTFYVMDEANQLGYNVNNLFLEYNSLHSGLAGKPIQSTLIVEGQVLQCFEHYCLVMDESQLYVEKPAIKVLNLGERYLKSIYPEKLEPIRPTSTPTLQVQPRAERLRLFGSYTAPNLITGKKSSIQATVLRGNRPAAGQNLYIVILISGDNPRELIFNMPPTNGSGRTSVELSGLDDLANQRVEYEICMITLQEDDFCDSGASFFYQP